jgi:hypothetical protein
MEDKYIIEETENSITWDYNVIDGISESSCNSHLYEQSYTMEQIDTMIKIDEAINAMHNHELYSHYIAMDYAPLALCVINTIAIIYLIYKQNTNK